MSLMVFYITNNPDVALIAEEAGVDRIWIDLETLGKESRQRGIDTVKSHHSIHDIEVIAPMLTRAEMLVRVNPWNENSREEIDRVVDAGAGVVMLPMWKTVEEVKQFIDVVGARVKTTLLLETKEAEACLDQVLELDGVDEIHIGLNDLHLSYGLSFMFEPLSNGTVERIVNKIKSKGLPYGFGGISHLNGGMIPAEMIILEHYRLGSTRAILSRSFCDQGMPLNELKRVFTNNMNALRAFEKTIDPARFEINRKEFVRMVDRIVAEKRHG